jgi:hypothetical protein
MPAKVDVPELLEILDKVVRESPSGMATTRECFYTEGASKYGPDLTHETDAAEYSQPHCIAGCAVFEIGGAEALGRLKEDRIIDASPNGAVLGSLRFTDEAVVVLAAAQRAQDSGDTWGEALGKARRIVALMAYEEGEAN